MIGNIIAAWIVSGGYRSNRSPGSDPFGYMIAFALLIGFVLIAALRAVPWVGTAWQIALGLFIASWLACGVFPARGGRWEDGKYRSDPRDLCVGASLGLSALLAVTTGLAYMFHA